ncbi:MAG: zinc-binding dehydrogenase [Phycisphaerales bacterium]
MLAAILTKAGPNPAHNIAIVNDWPEPPAPGPGEAQVRTLASALNHLDLWVGMGTLGAEITFPRVGGSDACGIVESVGPGVDGAWVGRKVIVNAAIARPERRRPDDPPEALAPDFHLLGEQLNGFHCARFNAPAANIAAVDAGADPVEAAGFALTHLTAWSMMITKAGMRPGQSVLITGIGGGVALAALTIAKRRGCRTIVTSRHAWKLERARELGADHGVLDSGSDWSKEVRTLTGKRGVDLAVDSSGKATHLPCIKSLARGGAYVTPGCTSGADATTDLARIFWNQLRILGSTMGSNGELAQLAAIHRAGYLRAVVDSTFEARDAAKAYARLESAEQFGKVVLRWPE